MATAVYIRKLDANHAVTGDPILFEQYEIGEGNRPPYQKTILRRAQNGKPTIFILTDDWYIINLTVRRHGDSTQSKLDLIRNHAAAGLTFRVYPQYIDAITYYRNCRLSPEILIDAFFSGEDMAGKLVNLKFLSYSAV